MCTAAAVCCAAMLAYATSAFTTMGNISDNSCFQKNSQGTRSWFAALLLFPVTAFFTVWHAVRARMLDVPPSTLVATLPNVWVGGRISNLSALPYGVDVVVDLTSEVYDCADVREAHTSQLYVCLPSHQGRLCDTIRLQRIVRALAKARRPEGGPLSVYVHCVHGDCKSAAFASLLLQAQGRYGSWRGAYAHIRRMRPWVYLTPQIVASCDAVSFDV